MTGERVKWEQSETKKIQTLGRPLGAQGPHLRIILAIVSVCVFYSALAECILGESGPRGHPGMSV